MKYFRAVASTLNFSKAAEHLHIAQPPLSRQIQQLESELGVQLLDRSSRPLKLTNAGVFLYEQSVRLLDRIEAIQNETRRLGGEARRWMGIGFAPSILYGFIPNAIRQFSLDNENIEISLLELTSVQQAEALKAGRIDIGFGRLMIEDEALENILLTEEPLIAALPAYSPLAAERCIPLERLLEEVLVLYPASPRPSFIDQLLQQFTAKGYKIGKTLETNGLQTAIGLVAAGMGVTLVPKSVQRLRRDDVSYRPVSDRGLSAALIMTMRMGDTSDHVMKFRAMIIDASMAKPVVARSKKP